MYKVYWTETTNLQQKACYFDFAELEPALEYTEYLRSTEFATHVVLAVENPNCTSLAGAQVMSSKNYHWRKRRHF